MAPLFRSQPESEIPQPDYLNTVAEFYTSLTPIELLAWTQKLERASGRQGGGPRNAPRPLDLDLLLYGEQESSASTLQLPHPRLHLRAFVLAPLAALSPEVLIPKSSRTAAAVWESWENRSTVRRVPWSAADR